MRMFEPSKWKVGQPTLRVVVVLFVLGAASSVIGACVSSQPLPERQEAVTRLGTQSCDREAGEVTLAYDSASGTFNPDHLCMKKGAWLVLRADVDNEITLCFSKKHSGGGWENKGPFEGENPLFKFSMRDSQALRRKQVLNVDATYRVTSSRDGTCPPRAGTGDDDHFPQAMSGTLEVGTG
jgi:hypothetical protein